MKSIPSIIALVVVLADAQVSSPQTQSYAAVLPLPPALRAGATVVRLTRESVPQLIRQGTNGLVCIDDVPGDSMFDVRCYRDTFIPVVYRAFQFGYDPAGPKVGEEVRSGKLPLSKEATAGYRCLGPATGYNTASNTIDATVECWESLHVPFRTAVEFGFPDERDVPEDQQRTTPYVMASGSYWSHVMLRHPPSQQPTAVTPVGVWRGTSVCLVRPSACNDETVVYRITPMKTPDSLAIDARKIVRGVEEEMGVLTCRGTSPNGQVTCTMPQGVWHFSVRRDSLVGELRLTDNTKYRDVRTKRAP